MPDTFAPEVTPPTPERKRFAIWKSPLPEVMTLDEARTAASKLVLEGKGVTMYILEVVEAIEPFTRVVPYPGK